VRQKIFISYRRQDTASSALALGLGQYLAREFGKRNVFIDVDMSAGTNFPAVLEMRLAECKVLLALIGPSWLNAQDDKGQRRLDDPEDWVRLEIARALNRNITVIPVRIGSTELPKRADLPEEIRSLVDHQAAVVTTEGFRNDMAGLTSDIHAIPNQWPWKRIGAIVAAATVLFVGGLIGLLVSVQPSPPPVATPPYSKVGNFACFNAAEYPDSWREEAPLCVPYGCNFGKMSQDACLTLGAKKRSKTVILAGNALHSRAGAIARWLLSDLAFGQLSRRSARG
jgi:TIR domain